MDSMKLAVCQLNGYDIIFGKTWHEDCNVHMCYTKDKVTFRDGEKRISLRTTIDIPEKVISKHRLVQQLKKRNPVFAIVLRAQEPRELFCVTHCGPTQTSQDNDSNDL